MNHQVSKLNIQNIQGRSWTPRAWALSFVLPFFTVSACSTTATLRSRDGAQWEGRILGTDGENVVVDTDSGIERFARDEVVIDHPGNGAALLGATIVVTSLAALAATGGRACGASDASGGLRSNEARIACPAVLAPLTLGTILTVWGAAVWSSSRDAEVRPFPALRLELGPTADAWLRRDPPRFIPRLPQERHAGDPTTAEK